MNAEKYTYRVIWSKEDKEHVGLCAEFPGLSHLAPTAGEALAGILELVAGVLKLMAKEKETPPEPMSTREYKGKILVRVPPEQHRELDMEAAEQGVSLNRLISQKLARGVVEVTRHARPIKAKPTPKRARRDTNAEA